MKHILFLLALAFTMVVQVQTVQAASVTINTTTAEVVATGNKTRDFLQLNELLIIYRSSTGGFEIQVANSRSKAWGGIIDSVAISGASTAAQKLAFLRTLMLETTTTNGYRCFIGRRNIEYSYTAATNRLDIKSASNKQPLWFGSVDSLQVGALSGAAAKLVYLRSVNKWRAQDFVPNATAATIAVGAAAGSSPTVAITGDAFAGTVVVTVGASGATTGVLATITTKVSAPTGYRLAIAPKDDNATLHNLRIKWTTTATTIVMNVPATALTAGGVYTFDYVAVPY